MTFNKEVAIGLNTFLRDNSLKRFIASCQLYYPEIKIYIVDQAKKFDLAKKKFYAYLRSEGHMIQQIPYDCGISRAREILRKFVKEPYIMYMQDDFIICNKTNIYGMLEILKRNKEIGVVCGSIIDRKSNSHTTTIPTEAQAHFLKKINDKMVYMPVQYLIDKGLINYKSIKNVRYLICDMGLDFSLWKKEAQKDIFDENAHVLEHTHTYLNLQKLKKFKAAYTPDSLIIHTHDRTNPEYAKFRSRKNDLPYLCKYWKVDSFRILTNKELPLNLITSTEIPQTKSTNISETNKILSEFATILQQLNKTLVLAKKSCLQAVVIHRFFTTNSYVYISSLTSDEIQYLASKNFFYLEQEQAFIKDNHKIYIEYKLIPQTKIVNVEGKNYNVPFPAHPYLEKLYGKNWITLGQNYGR